MGKNPTANSFVYPDYPARGIECQPQGFGKAESYQCYESAGENPKGKNALKQVATT
jgi:hypothetical protein